VHTLATVVKGAQSGVCQLRRIDAADFALSDRLTLADSYLDLWRVDLDATAEAESRWRSLLSEDELQRANASTSTEIASIFARPGPAEDCPFRIPGGTSEDIAFRYLEKGKPELAAIPEAGQLNFNVSHSGGVALFGIPRRWRDVRAHCRGFRIFDVEHLDAQMVVWRERPSPALDEGLFNVQYEIVRIVKRVLENRRHAVIWIDATHRRMPNSATPRNGRR